MRQPRCSESYKHLTAMKERNILLVNIIQMLIDKLANLLCVCFLCGHWPNIFDYGLKLKLKRVKF